MITAIQRFESRASAVFIALGLLILCAAPFSEEARGQMAGQTIAQVTAPSRPASVPADYVITPVGYFHPSCARQLADDATLLSDGRVAHEDGTVDAKVPACNYPHYSATGLPVSSGKTVPAINGWLEYISTTTNTSYAEIAATWTVPSPPTTDEGQTLFFFPGFEDTSDIASIVQPVLQFGPSAAGGGDYWSISSWNCCVTGTVWYSVRKKVSTGDTILGTITPMCKPAVGSCAVWKIATKDLTTGKKSVLHQSPSQGQTWNWAFGAVSEDYGVKQCGDFPADSSVVFTVQLYDQNLNQISNPGWVGTPATEGTSPECNYGLNVTATEETLDY
ncbi:MAG TPA: hypothetical protein VJK27_11085 [Terriglobales bacterium]|nr:hypothetical protein [Terriglobales bacterium]